MSVLTPPRRLSTPDPASRFPSFRPRTGLKTDSGRSEDATCSPPDGSRRTRKGRGPRKKTVAWSRTGFKERTTCLPFLSPLQSRRNRDKVKDKDINNQDKDKDKDRDINNNNINNQDKVKVKDINSKDKVKVRDNLPLENLSRTGKGSTHKTQTISTSFLNRSLDPRPHLDLKSLPLILLLLLLLVLPSPPNRGIEATDKEGSRVRTKMRKRNRE